MMSPVPVRRKAKVNNSQNIKVFVRVRWVDEGFVYVFLLDYVFFVAVRVICVSRVFV